MSLEGGIIAFTGRLASMKRADAFALVTKHGGKPRKGIRVLIVGGLGWPLQDDGRPSNSLATAKSYGIPIVLPAEIIEQLSMFGLIEAEDGHYGFRDLAAARQVAQLLGSGID